MKRLNYLLFLITCSFVGISFVYAAKPSYSFYTSSGTVEEGSKVTATVTVKNTAAWNIKIISAGNTNGCTNQWADTTENGKDTTKSFSVTCTAKGVGKISFTLTGDISGSDGTVSLSGTKSVSVIEKVPDSVINTLKSITVGDYKLNPEFSADTLEYSVTVPPTTTKIKIDAVRTDNKSSVSGLGEHEVEDGTNRFEIVVKAQSGAIRTYVVNVNVEDSDPINVVIDGETYSILKTSRSITIPSLYEEDTITIGEYEVPCFVNETNGLTLLALKNSLGVVSFYIYKDDTYIKYIELVGNTSIVYPLDKEINIKNFVKTTCNIMDNSVTCYKYKTLENDYYLMSAINLEDGEEHIYVYDDVSKSFQIFNEELYNTLLEDSNFYMYIVLGSVGVIFVCLLIIISLLSSKKKIKKLLANLENKMKSGSVSKNEALIGNISRSNAKGTEELEEKRNQLKMQNEKDEVDIKEKKKKKPRKTDNKEDEKEEQEN